MKMENGCIAFLSYMPHGHHLIHFPQWNLHYKTREIPSRWMDSAPAWLQSVNILAQLPA